MSILYGKKQKLDQTIKSQKPFPSHLIKFVFLFFYKCSMLQTDIRKYCISN